MLQVLLDSRAVETALAGTEFTCFTGAKVQILTLALSAPGYLGAVASIIACFFVWFNLVEGPRKALTKRVPLAHLSPRSLAYFYPLTACAALELVVQVRFS